MENILWGGLQKLMLKLCVQHHAWQMFHWLPITSLRLIMMKKCPHEKQRKNMPKIYCKRAANKRTLEKWGREREKNLSIGFALHRWLISNMWFFSIASMPAWTFIKMRQNMSINISTDIYFCSSMLLHSLQA